MGMCRVLKQRALRFASVYNYGLHYIRSAFLANMTNGEWFSHIHELARTGETIVDNWHIKKCTECGIAYVVDESLDVCHHCLTKSKSKKPIIQTKHCTRKWCAECGRVFIDTSVSQRTKYCSDVCRSEAYRRADREYRRKRNKLLLLDA